MQWLKNLLKFQEPALRKIKDTTGRQIMLKIYSSIAFFDQSIKKISNENIHMMKFMIKSAQHKKLAAEKEVSTTE